jgi:hypothetical protein
MRPSSTGGPPDERVHGLRVGPLRQRVGRRQAPDLVEQRRRQLLHVLPGTLSRPDLEEQRRERRRNAHRHLSRRRERDPGMKQAHQVGAVLAVVRAALRVKPLALHHPLQLRLGILDIDVQAAAVEHLRPEPDQRPPPAVADDHVRVPQRLQDRRVSLQRQPAELPDLVDRVVRVVPRVRVLLDSAHRHQIAEARDEDADIVVVAALDVDAVRLASRAHDQGVGEMLLRGEVPQDGGISTTGV